LRLDSKIVALGLVKSREKAKRLINSGFVFVNDVQIQKTSIEVNDETIKIVGDDNPYVARGGLKLEKAIKKFNINLNNKIAMDVGASTGGFTDCMLQFGAKKVYAIDVGFGQLDEKLINDKRVINLEKTNIRSLTKDIIPNPVDFCSVDVSFISLTLVIPTIHSFLKDNGELVCLIKPQFEAGRANIGKRGIIKDNKIHKLVLNKICQYMIDYGYEIINLDFSPIKGGDGNIEFLIYLRKNVYLNQVLPNIDEITQNANNEWQ
jgi:23S rRNA (cytidine1920-2'-O)/16S rRNA (cytidine1409-2'-O)-methyltransferase